MLPRQIVELFRETIARRQVFLEDLRLAHLVQLLDRHLGILAAELDQGDAAIGFQRPTHLRQHRLGIAELVVDIDQQDQIAGVIGEFRVRRTSEDQFDVVETRLVAALFEHVEHRLLDVDAVDLTRGPDPPGQPQGVITVATAEITDCLPLLHAKSLHQNRDPLLLLARLPQQPLGTLPVHRLGDGAAPVLRLLILLRDTLGGQRAE